VTTPCHNVGAFVPGSPYADRHLTRHAELLAAYADGVIADQGDEREAYLSLFVFGAEMQQHFAATRNSVAGFAGPCWCRWLVLDIDRPNLVDALADARRLVTFLRQRYPEADDVPVWFSGSKGFHVAVELANNPSPAVGFNAVCRTLAEAIARNAGVKIDSSIYDVNHIVRLPNTRHPKTGLFKRRLDADALFRLDIDAIREHAKHPAGDGIPSARTVSEQLATDWTEAEQHTTRTTTARTAARRDFAPGARAPRYLVDLLRFGASEGERHTMLFRSAAWLAEQGAPPSLILALLTEPGCDVGLMPKEVERQIRCGIEHARRQRHADHRPDPLTEPDAFERWAIDHEDDPSPSAAMDFPFGALAPGASEGGHA
jgi:hypothetical protein